MIFGGMPANAAQLKLTMYILSKEAAEDLTQIANYGDQQFGNEQSDKYRDKLKSHFIELSDHPLHYQAVDHIRKGYRRSVCGSHAIYYRIQNETVEIMRVLGRQDPFAALQ